MRVDEVGRAEAIAYKAMEAQADPLDPTTKYFLNRFIYDFYSRRKATVQENWSRSLRFLTTELANASFRAESQTSPFSRRERRGMNCKWIASFCGFRPTPRSRTARRPILTWCGW